jgi:hypothetical protein
MKFFKSTLAMTSATFTALTLFVGYVAPSTLGIEGMVQAASASKLGDLSRFRNLAADITALVNKGDMAAAKKRTTDLESAWDGAEAGIKPRSAADWHLVDKSLDKLYSAIRADKPDVVACKQALSDVLSTMDKAGGK